MNSVPETTSVTAPAPRCLTDVGETTRWFNQEVQPHEQALRSYVRSRFPTVDVDDVVQDSYLKILKAHARGTVAVAKTYIFAIARNSALAVFRRRKFFSDVPVSELPEWRVLDQSPDAATVMNLRQQYELAEAAIQQLPPRCREIIQLAAFEQLRPADIAIRLGLAEATVYVQLARGFRRCADYLRARGELP